MVNRMTRKQLRGLAKTGMTASLAALVLTGMHPGRGNRTAHTWAGIALVGFSVWHHNLYAANVPGRVPVRERNRT
ncbi:MAG: hypothetical protein JW781_07355 [Deltaproteobacteria bacterium]|nr:hypothetical protein [Candidatus Anaeroferrophillacea bacterium]